MSTGEQTYSISEIREEIMHLPAQFDQEPSTVTVTSHGQPIMAILPWERYKALVEAEKYEALIETMEIMSDEELMAAFRQGVQELKEGKGRPWDEVRKDLGW